MNAMRFAAAIAAMLLATAARGTDDAGIARLVAQLGDKDFATREAAETALTEMGTDALSALEKAQGSDDPEISTRAKRAFESVVHPDEAARRRLRAEAAAAFRSGDYAKSAALGRRLAAASNAEFGDHLRHGHARQMAGEWTKAAEAYRGGLARVAGRTDFFRRSPEDWTKLAILVGRIERCEVKDAAAAAKTLAAALATIDAEKWDGGETRLDLLKELADAQDASGDARGAIETWTRLDEACRKTRPALLRTYLDVERVARAFSRLAPDPPPSEFPSLFLLTPAKPGLTLLPDDPETRRRSYSPSPGGSVPHWYYAFVPPPGREFDVLEIACDVEQFRPQHTGQLRCFVMADSERPVERVLGCLDWPATGEIGRKTLRGKFEAPPGVRAVRAQTGSFEGVWKIHSIEVEATFREATKDARPVEPKANEDAWLQIETLPKGGDFICGKQTLAPESCTGIKPGRYHLHYEVDGPANAFDADLDLAPGRRYGAFVNLESPFRWTPVALDPAGPGRLSLAPLADGAWLAAWCAADSRIMTARSRDLVAWEKPEALPFNSIFANVEPATYAARDGTVWLAWFAKRFALPDASTGGYTLFLTSTRDGRAWTPPRPVSIPMVDGWPLSPAQLMETKDGKCRIGWRAYAGSGASFAEVRELAAIAVDKLLEKKLVLWNPHVSQDEKGLFHMVFDNFGRGIHHTTSADGVAWREPAEWVEGRGDISLSDAQLILRDGQAVLVWSANTGTYAAPVRFDVPPLRAGSGLKITNHVVPMNGSRLTLTKDGEAVFLAGKDSLWLLRAKLSDLLDPAPAGR